jgi:hypothetical protein
MEFPVSSPIIQRDNVYRGQSQSSTLTRGAWADKVGYSDGRVLRRFFWYEALTHTLHWGTKTRDQNSLRVCLDDVVGVLFGPMTTSFRRASLDGTNYLPWRCVSLMFVGRTLDLCFEEGVGISWFLELQYLTNNGGGFSRIDLVRQQVRMKIEYRASSLGRSLAYHFKRTVIESFQELYPADRDRSKVSSSPESHISRLRSELNSLRSLVPRIFDLDSFKSETVRKLEEFVLTRSSEPSGYQAELSRLALENRAMRDELISLKGRIRVIGRVRPLLKQETRPVCSLDDMPYIVPYSDRVSLFSAREVRRKTFVFDRVLTTSQTELFEEIRPVVDCAVDGYNVCVFAYGPTNSGKSYTMEGTVDDPGMTLLAIERIFRQIEFTRKSFRVSIACHQIYNETVMDLLNGMHELTLKTSPKDDGFCVVDGTSVIVDSEQHALAVVKNASRMRTTKSTNLNDYSSRSHFIVTIFIENLLANTKGKLHLIDLAGSENVNKSGATGHTLRETQSINKSLSALGDVIQALLVKPKESKPHIPFRNSKLTMLLKDSLLGNSKTLMIVQLSPSDTDIGETHNSLAFAQRVRNVEVGRPYRNQ